MYFYSAVCFNSLATPEGCLSVKPGRQTSNFRSVIFQVFDNENPLTFFYRPQHGLLFILMFTRVKIKPFSARLIIVVNT